MKLDTHIDSRKVVGRDGPIPVSVSEISAYRHVFQYRRPGTPFWLKKSAISAYRQRSISAYWRIGKNMVSAHPKLSATVE